MCATETRLCECVCEKERERELCERGLMTSKQAVKKIQLTHCLSVSRKQKLVSVSVMSARLFILSPTVSLMVRCQQDGVYTHGNVSFSLLQRMEESPASTLFRYREDTRTRTHSPCGGTISLHGMPVLPTGSIFIQQPLGLW